jgi:antitoxin (DNA-binding transcriptional repressor) of toxin-antitoxin stability system
MMVSVDVSELKQDLDRFLHEVEDEGQTVEITRLGRVVAHLAPAPVRPAAGTAEFWAEWDALAERIGRTWPEGVSAADAVKEDRREL